MTELSRTFGSLSAEEALRALYIDFEGQKDQPPVLLGSLRRSRGPKPHVQHDIVDASFATLGGRSVTLREAVENVVLRAERGERRIVSWSEHDLRVVRLISGEDPELVARFERRYANARLVAQRWRNKIHDGSKPAVGTLGEYLALIGYAVPAEGAAGNVGETIRILREQLDSGRPVTRRHLERWANLLEHNRHDCAGMQRICLRATTEIDAARGRPVAIGGPTALGGPTAIGRVGDPPEFGWAGAGDS